MQFAFDTDGSISGLEGDAPLEIHLEATNAEGEVAPWLDDYFWMELIQRWSDAPVSVQFLPTPNCLLHGIIAHQLNMLRRVVPHWRLIGQCYLSDLEEPGAIEQAGVSVYHELHIINERRTGVEKSNRPLRVEDAIATMREVQRSNKRNSPIVICDQASGQLSRPAQPSSPRSTTESSATSRVLRSMA